MIKLKRYTILKPYPRPGHKIWKHWVKGMWVTADDRFLVIKCPPHAPAWVLRSNHRPDQGWLENTGLAGTRYRTRSEAVASLEAGLGVG